MLGYDLELIGNTLGKKNKTLPLPVVSQLGVGPCEHLSSMLECWLAGSCIWPDLSQAILAAVSSGVPQFCHVQKTLFPSALWHLPLTRFHPSSLMFPRLEWNRLCVAQLPLRAEFELLFLPAISEASRPIHSCANSALHAGAPRSVNISFMFCILIDFDGQRPW